MVRPTLITGAVFGLVWCLVPSPVLHPQAQRSASIRAGNVHRYRIQLSFGQYARFEVLQREIDLDLEILDSQGAVVNQAAMSEFGPEAIDVVARSAGPHVLLVKARTDDSSHGAYDLHWRLSESRATYAHRRRVEGARLYAAAEAVAAVADEPAPKERLRLLTAAAAEFSAANDCLHEAQTYQRIGITFARTGSYLASDRSLQRAIQLFGEANDQAAILDARKYWINNGGHIGEERGTREALGQMLKAWRSTGDARGVARIAASLARAEGRAGQPHNEKRYLQEALDIHSALGMHEDVASDFAYLAGLAIRQRNYREAEHFAEKELAERRITGDRRSLTSAKSTLLAVYVHSGDWAAARDLAAVVAEDHRHANDQSALASVVGILGDAESRLGQHEAAMIHINEAVEIHDSLMAESGKAVPLRALASRTFRANALLRQDHAKPGRGFAAKAWAAQEEMLAHSVGVAVEDLVSIRKRLGPDTVLLQEGPSDDEIRFWLITRDSVTTASAGDQEGLLALAARFAKEHGLSTARAELSRRILHPVADKIVGKRIVFIPGKEFAGVPWGALADPADPSGQTNLLASHELMTLPAASLLAKPPQPRATGKLMAVLADPVFGSGDPRARQTQFLLASDAGRAKTARLVVDLPRLPHGHLDSLIPRSLIAQNQFDLFEGFGATREAALAPEMGNHTIIHFGTHAWIDSSNPEMTAMALSLITPDGQPRNGLLRLRDIYAMKLRSSLVTLSACETGVGEAKFDFGPMSLTNAFLHAGARRVVASLWKVDDEATAELMQRFYQHLLGKARMTPAAALRAAQLEIAAIPRWSEPYYWAGFALYGEWGAL